jgi:hypothetical protein
MPLPECVRLAPIDAFQQSWGTRGFLGSKTLVDLYAGHQIPTAMEGKPSNFFRFWRRAGAVTSRQNGLQSNSIASVP